MRALGHGVVNDATVPATQTSGAGGGKKPPGNGKTAAADSPSWNDRFRRPAEIPGSVSVPGGAQIAVHELATARRLTHYGVDVAFRPVVREIGAKNPDVDMEGQVWEFKSPKGASEKSTIASQFRRGRRQSANLVIDLARCGLSDELAIGQICGRFAGQEQIVQLIIIDHGGHAIYLSK